SAWVSPRCPGIDHVQLAMPAGPRPEEQADGFYGALLGFERIPKPAELAARGGCWFTSSAVQLHLGVDEPFRPARKAHPALKVDQLDPLLAQFAAAGVDGHPAEDVDGRRRVHVDDPFGNRIELIETHTAPPQCDRAPAD